MILINVTSIINDGVNLKITVEDRIVNEPKEGMKLGFNSTERLVLTASNSTSYELSFTRVTNPVAASDEELRVLIDAMLETGAASTSTPVIQDSNAIYEIWFFDAAVTDDVLVAVASGKKAKVLECEVFSSGATTVNVGARVGFSSTGSLAPQVGGGSIVGMLTDHPKIKPGGGFVIGDGSAVIGAGTDDQDILASLDVPTDGGIAIKLTYVIEDA